MGLADEIAAEHAAFMVSRYVRQPCHVQVAMDEVGEGDADELWERVMDHSLPARVISRVLERRGIHLGVSTVERHRRGECRWCIAQGRL